MQYQYSATLFPPEAAVISRLPSADMTFLIRSIYIGREFSFPTISPTAPSILGLLALWPPCKALSLHSPLPSICLVMTVQIALRNHVHVPIVVALVMYFIGGALPTSLTLRYSSQIQT